MTPIVLFLSAFAAYSVCATDDVERSNSGQGRARTVDNRHVFNPRMDYDEWTPLGRGDPLKNDPTYDYVPPVLDRVHYWIDPSKRTPDPPLPNSGVVVVTTRTEPSPTTVLASSRLDTMTLLDPFLKFMDVTKSTLGYSTPVSSYFRPTPNPAVYTQPTVHANVYGAPHPPRVQGVRPPYTMLVPPPIPSSTEVFMTSFATSTTSTTSKIEKEQVTSSSSLLTPESTTDATVVTSITTASSPTTNLANSENLYKPVAINMPEAISNHTDEGEYVSNHQEEVEMEAPMGSTFHGGTNYLHVHDVQTPSLVMIPPPQGSDDFYGFRPTTVRTTTITTLTTDPMFKHYKQPSEPMRGPFYLIIQGHSKVKTYGASKNKVKAVSSNEINFEDGKIREDDDDLASSESYRRERKLRFKDSEYIIDDDSAEVVQGHPIIELSASYKSKGQTIFSVSKNDSVLDHLEEAFPKTEGGSSKKKVLTNDLLNGTSNRERRFVSRRLLTTEALPNPQNDNDHLDKEQLGLESLIALNDDYNSEDVINLLLKEEGQGSGLGGLAASLFSRSLKRQEEI